MVDAVEHCQTVQPEGQTLSSQCLAVRMPGQCREVAEEMTWFKISLNRL